MLGEHGSGEAGHVALGARVEFATDVLDRLVELARRAAAGALEQHMLEQMREAVMLLGLVARSGAREQPDRRGLDPGHRSGHHAQAAGKGRDLSHLTRRWRTASA